MSRFPTLVVALLAAATCASTALPAADVSIRLNDQAGKPIADAVVSLVPLDAPVLPSPPQTEIPEIVQANEQFSPFITVIRTGTTVAFPNRDKVDHYLFSQSPAKSFQFPLYAPTKSEKVTFDKAGVVALGCDIHDKMIAYVIVLDTPWFTRTGSTGAAVIANLPTGRYRADIWHAQLEEIDHRELTIGSDGGPTSITRQFELKPPRRVGAKLGGARGGYR